MKTASTRKSLIKAIEGVGVNEFATNEEMIAARALHSMMLENSKEVPKRRKSSKKERVLLADQN